MTKSLVCVAFVLLPVAAMAQPATPPMSEADMTAMDHHTGQTVTQEEPPSGPIPAPAPPEDHAADNVYDPVEMAKARAVLAHESGALPNSYIGFDLAELQLRQGKWGYRWEGEAWFGGDIDKFKVKHEGEGDFGGKLQDFEVQALWSHAVDPWWDLQLGIRHDVKPRPSRTYLVAGLEGVAPYWFKLSGAVFFSNKGDLHARAEAHYDQRITERLIAQPRLEANLSAQAVPEIGIGAGLTSFELGLRIRYEIRREVAPYIGFEWQTKGGETAKLARQNRENPSKAQMVIGMSFWF